MILRTLAELIDLPDPEITDTTLRYGFPHHGPDRTRHWAGIELFDQTIGMEFVDEEVFPRKNFTRNVIRQTADLKTVSTIFIDTYRRYDDPVGEGEYFLSRMALVENNETVLNLLARYFQETYGLERNAMVRLASSIAIGKGIPRSTVETMFYRIEKNMKALLEVIQ